MSYAFPGAGALDYNLCHYEGSRLLFRGPARRFERPYVAVLGATESYGRFVERPFSDLVQGRLGLDVVNLACVNAGVDVYLNELPITQIAGKAEAAVVQVMGAQNISNRYYTVHPRRNDRFLGATPQLQALYRNVDFTEFSFTRHLLTTLRAASREKFAVVVAELRRAWFERMVLLVKRLPERRILLWMADGPPPEGSTGNLKRDPWMVDAQMIATLQPHFLHYLEVTPSREARQEGAEGRVCSETDRVMACSMPGQMFHRDVAEKLSGVLEQIM
jgi:hypothetical protein